MAPFRHRQDDAEMTPVRVIILNLWRRGSVDKSLTGGWEREE